ncbi:tRNA synthetases class I (M)-domain-containing protein [Russula earlei]|uniref:tRNA synthetases class I (M)-domain-containing protein n=1 Tax=Russula earlei TaxID=71964 RepID=A0ACC0UG38_9AGAM|nr:tRNA synthetases class I (M)-domain-containing protein [Russula earlei]
MWLLTKLGQGSHLPTTLQQQLILIPVPHIDHLYMLVMTDFFSRYARLSWPDKLVSFLTGTDEHGLKAAEAQNLELREFCDQISHRFRVSVYLFIHARILTTPLIWTSRIRRTPRRQRKIINMPCSTCSGKSLLYKGLHKGRYSVSDECFYTDNQIERLRSPHDAPNGTEKEIVVSKETGSVVEWTEGELQISSVVLP